jgi:spore germination cell wall hydrolase CwlJ-like protein
MDPTQAFLALVLWREARGETPDVRAAIAYVVLTRSNKPSWWGRSVLGVIFKRLQFSSLTAPGDPQLVTWPSPPPDGNSADWQAWTDCLTTSAAVLAGSIPNPTPGADSYYDISIRAPAWATTGTFIGQLGNVRFYETVP